VSIIVYIAILACVYVTTFKEDFKEEDLQKAIPFIAILFIIALISALL